MFDSMFFLVVLGLMAGSGVAGAWSYEEGRRAWRRYRQPPADFQVTLHDADGVVVKSAKLTARRAAELVTQLNREWAR